MLANEGTENQSSVPEDISDFYKKLDHDEDDELDINVVSYEINQTYLERLQKRLIIISICFEYGCYTSTRHSVIS